MFDLSGRTVVVTGGNGGIGFGLARGVARAGANVAIWARNEEKNERARGELETLGAKVITVSCDVASEAEILAAIEQTAGQETGGGGKLVVTSSMVEHFGSPMQAHYAASKGAVGSLVKSLAVRLARHDIQVNAIQPGWIISEATAAISQSDDFNEVLMKRIPARRWGDAADFEGIAVYLASDESRYHTGDSILIDGAYTIF
ncbi:MAG: SDR family oxidoreductase [Myxococcota bacterium]|jgi:hypothetical protein|nr:SDR family oxidoreductase [Myxococcota bacterium]